METGSFLIRKLNQPTSCLMLQCKGKNTLKSPFNSSFKQKKKIYIYNKFQTSCNRNTVKLSTVKYSTALYFCKAVPHAVVFVVVFQVYARYLMFKLYIYIYIYI